jgi:hypothetical protein
MFTAVRVIAAARGDCQNDVNDWQCSDELFSVIAQMYSIIVGDVKLEMFQSSGAMTAMFVLFTKDFKKLLDLHKNVDAKDESNRTPPHRTNFPQGIARIALEFMLF